MSAMNTALVYVISLVDFKKLLNPRTNAVNKLLGCSPMAVNFSFDGSTYFVAESLPFHKTYFTFRIYSHIKGTNDTHKLMLSTEQYKYVEQILNVDTDIKISVNETLVSVPIKEREKLCIII